MRIMYLFKFQGSLQVLFVLYKLKAVFCGRDGLGQRLDFTTGAHYTRRAPWCRRGLEARCPAREQSQPAGDCWLAIITFGAGIDYMYLVQIIHPFPWH